MAKGSKKKKKAAARNGGDEEMTPADGGWQTNSRDKGLSVVDADTNPLSLDDLIALDAKRSKEPKASSGVKKKESRGQKSKAQKLRKMERLEKAMAANDRYASKCTKKGQAKQMKTTLANIY